MKKILVVFTAPMELGGIETSLLGLLDNLNYEKYEVDLFVYGHHGPLYSAINPQCQILPEVKELAYLREGIAAKLKHGCFRSAFYRLKDAMTKNSNHDATWKVIMEKCVPELEPEYDLALGFFRPFDFLVDKVKAKVKVGWIHTDYRSAGEDLNWVFQDFQRMDYIAGVSGACCESFAQLFPALANKLVTIENCLSHGYIFNRANAPTPDMPEEKGCFRLLSIGRFSTAKNFDNVPAICRTIRDSGLDVKWYLIGYGGDELLIRRKIQEAGMQEYVIILGKKAPPYPYIAACDLYVQPSRYEGKCVAVREAQMLCKPVVITNYATSSSQLEDGVDGVIVPMDIERCAQGIAELLRNPERMRVLSENCAQRDYSNSEEVEKLYRLLG